MNQNIAESIAVIICTRNRPDMIPMAVESVLACDYPNFSVHVMDQSTDNKTQDYVQSVAVDDNRLYYHHLDQPGLSRSYNEGFRITDEELIACTDDDVVVPPDWLCKVSNRFATDKKIGLIYGQVLVPETLLARYSDGIIVPSLKVNRLEFLRQEDNNFRTFGMGANCMIRRSMLKDTLGFDEALGGGAPLRSSQDFDLSYRTYLSGWTICLDPDIVVDHFGTRTRDQWPETMANYGVGDGAYYGKFQRIGDPWASKILRQRRLKLSVSRITGIFGRRASDHDYLANIDKGISLAREFDVDPKTRLYKTRDGSSFGVTESNKVTLVP